MRPGIFEEKSNNHLKEVTVKIRERYRASTYAQLEETASGDSNRVKEKRFLSFIALGNAVLADEFLARAYNKQESFRFGVMSTSSIQQARYATVASVTLFCRTAIDNGLPENLAYSISDSYLLHLDETESIDRPNDIGRKSQPLLRLGFLAHAGDRAAGHPGRDGDRRPARSAQAGR